MSVTQEFVDEYFRKKTIARLDWQSRINDVTQVIDKPIYKFLEEPKSKKAKFKQSKFDQINSFGKKNVNSR